jgi:hypothetical protein
MPSSRPRAAAFVAVLCTTLVVPAGAQQFSWEFDPEAIQAIEQAATGTAARLLRNAILQSRSEALRAGVQAIPPKIRAELRGFYPDALLDRVRFRVGGGSDQSLQLNVIQYGERAAITLDDVVVFADEQDAAGNAELWVHELWHVQQFAQWGVDDFSLRYARDYRSVEADAEAAAARYLATRRR